LPEEVIWVVRAGSQGEGDQLFRKGKKVGVHFIDQDLSKLAADREAFKAAYATAFPNEPPMAVANQAGQAYRFVHEMKVGELVIYPSKIDRMFHLGRIKGGYEYKAGPFPHQRAVEWQKELPRKLFTQGALYEANSAMTLFQIKNYAQEFLDALKGNAKPPVGPDPTIHQTADQIRESTRDFVLKTLATQLKGAALEPFIAHLLEVMGYRARLTGKSGDGGVDIIAHKDELGFVPPIIKVQVKSEEGKTAPKDVQALSAAALPGEFALFVTLGSFSKQAQDFGMSRSNMRLIGGDELVDLILEHYEQFDARYKGLLPLRKVYVPEIIAAADGTED
jgi:restriction system protein